MNTTDVIVLDVNEYDPEWPFPERMTLAQAISIIQGFYTLVPEKYWDVTLIEFGCNDYDGGCEPCVLIYYKRPENDEERERREQWERTKEAAARQDELRQLAALKAKYE